MACATGFAACRNPVKPTLHTDASGHAAVWSRTAGSSNTRPMSPPAVNLDLPERIIARRQDLSVKLVIRSNGRYSARCRSLAGTRQLNRMLHIVGRRAVVITYCRPCFSSRSRRLAIV